MLWLATFQSFVPGDWSLDIHHFKTAFEDECPQDIMQGDDGSKVRWALFMIEQQPGSLMEPGGTNLSLWNGVLPGLIDPAS